jgi:hypothetical protein
MLNMFMASSAADLQLVEYLIDKFVEHMSTTGSQEDMGKFELASGASIMSRIKKAAQYHGDPKIPNQGINNSRIP